MLWFKYSHTQEIALRIISCYIPSMTNLHFYLLQLSQILPLFLTPSTHQTLNLSIVTGTFTLEISNSSLCLSEILPNFHQPLPFVFAF